MFISTIYLNRVKFFKGTVDEISSDPPFVQKV